MKKVVVTCAGGLIAGHLVVAFKKMDIWSGRQKTFQKMVSGFGRSR